MIGLWAGNLPDSSEFAFNQINLVRYADDFIITGRTKERLENEVKPLVIEFLKERGLTLSEEKTGITHIEDGFDFLGCMVDPSVKTVSGRI
jgi:RNA-directed DNA polymerase